MCSDFYAVVVITAALIAGCGIPDPNEPDEPNAPPVLSESAGSTSSASSDADSASVRILFLGDSITAGYGIDQAEAFPARVETRLQGAGYNVYGIDAGVSGDTSTGGLNRLDWLLQNRVDILVLELGGNDGLRGINLSLTRSNLGAIIDKTRDLWPQSQIVLVGMRVPPNLGIDYTEEFADMYPDLATAYETHFVPFIAERFEDIMDLVQTDGIHPTEEGHAVIAEKIGDAVEPLVRYIQAERMQAD